MTYQQRFPTFWLKRKCVYEFYTLSKKKVQIQEVLFLLWTKRKLTFSKRKFVQFVWKTLKHQQLKMVIIYCQRKQKINQWCLLLVNINSMSVAWEIGPNLNQCVLIVDTHSLLYQRVMINKSFLSDYDKSLVTTYWLMSFFFKIKFRFYPNSHFHIICLFRVIIIIILNNLSVYLHIESWLFFLP